MLIRKHSGIEIPSSEITSRYDYVNRRQFMKGVGAIAAGALLAACRPEPPSAVLPVAPGATSTAPPEGEAPVATATTGPYAISEPLTPYAAVTGYNNYYEFTTDKSGVAALALDFPVNPWQVEVGGLVNKPGTYDLTDFRTKFDQEERTYRMRCVEGWSMVIPWQGFPLHKLLEEVEPTSAAKYVRFETVLDSDNMPGLAAPWYKWPYVEGLRLDEAMNDLTILATGLYGEDLPPQNGAPIRLVVPWKYGFKGIKSIVKIDLVAEQPTSLWMAAAPNEYGFYSNVNPQVSHPRWSQATERRIGEDGRRDTLMFNGYEEHVAHLYDGMDLRVNF